MATAPGGDLAERELLRQLATLSLSQVRPSGAEEALAAVAWWNLLARLGLRLPLVVVHDLGLLLRPRPGAPRAAVAVAPGSRGAPRQRYQELLAAVAGSDALEELHAASLPDEAVAVILARVIGDVYLRWPGRPRAEEAHLLPVTAPAYQRDRAELAGAHDPSWALAFMQRLIENERGVVARLEQIDAGTLRLLGWFASEGGAAGLLDLHHVVGAAGVADVVDFSLQLLPSLLETKRRPAAQRFSIDGYASVERRGSVDALLPGELAHDDEMFLLKALSDDLLYYGHERRAESARRLHYVLIDASASMRGARAVFARGLGLALCKKLALQGGDVWLRFFDSRLHDRMDMGKAPRRELVRFLGFRSERGRNGARVFGALAAELARLRQDDAREVALTFITHGECHIPAATVEALAREATLYGIFVLPSRPLALEYLPRLHRYQVVTAETLARGADKRRRALEIVEDAARR
jgi:hypothetical protein